MATNSALIRLLDLATFNVSSPRVFSFLLFRLRVLFSTLPLLLFSFCFVCAFARSAQVDLLAGHTDTVLAVDASADGKYLVSA